MQVSEIGKKLREARENKSVSLEEAEEKTKIRQFYLESLENDEFDNLPGKVYALGFLKKYAEYLGLPSQEFAEEFKHKVSWNDYEDEEEIKITQSKQILHESRKPNKKKYLLLIAGIVLVGLLLFAFFPADFDRDLGYFENDNDLIENNYIDDNNEEDIDVVNEDEDEDIYADFEGINLQLIVYRDSCWLSIEVDGEEVFRDTLYEGDEVEFEGEEEITALIGNVGAVRVLVNGEERELAGGLHDVETVTFTAD